MAADPVMSMSDIAALAGVQRPVVTTWRRRHPDFPAPISGEGIQAMFDARAVCDWLVSTGRADRRQVEPDLHLHTLTQIGESLPPRHLVAAMTALVCLRAVDHEPLGADGLDPEELRDRARRVDPTDLMLQSEINALPGEMCWLASTADAVVEAAWGCGRAFERIMAARARWGAQELSASTVDPRVARLMARLAGAADQTRQRSEVVVADPAAGPGDLLTAVIREIGEFATPVAVVAEPDGYLARLCRRRLVVHGVHTADQYITVGSELGEGAPDPDVVITQIPYQPSEVRVASDVLARIDEVALRLGPGRSAAVLGPAAVLAGPLHTVRELRYRADLLASGVVEAVISLPGGMVPFRPGYQTAVWVMTQAHDSRLRGKVLLADLSDRTLTDSLIEAVVTDVVTWRRDGYQAGRRSRRYCAEAEVGQLMARGGPLTARRGPTERERVAVVPTTVSRVNELERTLARLADTEISRDPVRTGVAQGNAPRPATASVAELARSRRMAVISGTRLAPAHVTSQGQHAVWGREEVTGRARIGDRTVDRAVLAEHYPRAVLTEPGDVLVTTAPDLGVVLDQDGYRIVEFPVRALRLRHPGREQLTPRVLAALLAGSGLNARRTAGAVRAPRRLADWQVPLLDSAVATRFDLLLAAMDQRRRLALDELDALDELGRLIAAGLAEGTLTLQP